jgi:hypothetical protein
MSTTASMEKLRLFLSELPPGELIPSEEHRTAVLQLLMDCWSSLIGSEEENTFSNKIPRAESVSWNPPLLKFQLERHGGTVNGSTRANVHYWEVNVDLGTAKILKNGQRQLSQLDKRMDTKALAQEIASCIINEHKHPAVVWNNDRDSVEIKISVIIPETYAQTTANRRKRFKQQLETILLDQGWIRFQSGNKTIFCRNKDES